MAATFSCDLTGATSSLPHFWEHTIGSGHAPRCEAESRPFEFRDGALGFDVTLPPLSVAAVTFRFAADDRG